MFYNMKQTTAIPRVVDAHSLLHTRAKKSAKACDAADLVDGLAVLQNYTLRLAAVAHDVSMGSVSRARRLTPEQRQAVRQGRRPLVLPRTPATPRTPSFIPTMPPVPPTTADARAQLHYIISIIGMDATLDLLLAVTGKTAATLDRFTAPVNGNGGAS
jgi:hypothetical protein